MPPKAGRRRGPRPAAKKSTPVTTPSPTDPQPASSSQNDTASDSQPTPPPPTDIAISSPNGADLASRTDVESEAGKSTDQTVVEAGDAVDVVAEGETAKNDVVSPVSEVKVDDDEGSKGKKVKKVVKRVVKKVIRKVPKKVVKEEGDEIQNPNLTNSDVIEGNEGEKKVVEGESEETQNPNLTIDKGEKKVVEGESEDIQNPNLTNSKVIEVDEGEKEVVKGETEEVQNPNLTNSDEIKVDEVENKVAKGESEEIQNPNLTNSKVIEVDDGDKKAVEGEGEEIQNPNLTNSNVMEVDEGEKKVEMDDKEKNPSGPMEVDNDEKEKEAKFDENGEARNGEDEMGEGKLFSGEMEALERKKRRKTEVFIGGLDKDATEEDVRKVFAEAGEIVDLRVVMNPKTGKNKGFAFLRYASAAHAKKALEMFARVEIRGKQCGATPVEGNDTLYLGNINKKWKDEDVVKLLQEVGVENVDKVTVMIDPNKSECNRGFAFVEFETSKDAQEAFKKLQKKDVFVNLNIKIAWAEPLKELDEEEMLKVKTIYAEFIPLSWDEEKVRDLFKKFGEIDNVILARNLRTTKRKDFAFVSYKTREDAVKCIESFSREVNEEGVNVKVSLAKPIQKGKKTKPAVRSFTNEAPNKKPKTSHVFSRPSDMRYMAQPMVPQYDVRMNQRSSTDAELEHLLREQAAWRRSLVSLGNSPVDVEYSHPLPGRRRPISMLEADPMYPDPSRYPYSPLDASLPIASSSHILHPSGHSRSMAYEQRRGGYPSGSAYGARNYPSNNEFRGRAPGSSNIYRRY